MSKRGSPGASSSGGKAVAVDGETVGDGTGEGPCEAVSVGVETMAKEDD